MLTPLLVTGYDGFAPFAGGSTANEVELAAATAVKLTSEGVRVDLSRDVHRESGIDGRHFRLLRDDERIVRVSHVHHGHAGIVVDEVVHFLGAHQECGNDLAFVEFFVHVVDDTFFEQREHAIGEHFGMDTQVFVVSELGKHGIGDCADTHLQGGSVFDKRGAIASDGYILFREGGLMGLNKRGVVLAEDVYVGQFDDGVAPCPRHARVDDTDDNFRILHGGKGGIHGGSHGHITVFVRRADLNHGHVHFVDSAADEFLCLAQVDGNIVGISRLCVFTDVGSHKIGLEVENAFEFRTGVRGVSFCVQVLYFHVFQFTRATSGAEGLNQTLRGASNTMKMNPVARFHDFHGLFKRYCFYSLIHSKLFLLKTLFLFCIKNVAR